MRAAGLGVGAAIPSAKPCGFSPCFRKNSWPGICLDTAGRSQAVGILMAVLTDSPRQAGRGGKHPGFPLYWGFGAQPEPQRIPQHTECSGHIEFVLS